MLKLTFIRKILDFSSFDIFLYHLVWIDDWSVIYNLDLRLNRWKNCGNLLDLFCYLNFFFFTLLDYCFLGLNELISSFICLELLEEINWFFPNLFFDVLDELDFFLLLFFKHWASFYFEVVLNESLRWSRAETNFLRYLPYIRWHFSIL
jgi:hypothetical protein